MTAKEKHTNDLKLLLGTHVKTVKTKLPKFADAFEKRVNEELHRPFTAFLDKQEAIRLSGRYTSDGERAELRLAARAVQEKLAAVKTDTVTKLEAQLAEKRAAALKPKAATTEPLQAILKEMRQKELRDHLRSLDPLALQTRIRLAVDDGASADLLEALDGAPAGFAIAPPELVQEAKVRIAEKNHPELGELAQLRDAYTYALGVVEQGLLEASGLSAVELGTDPTPTRDTRQPTLVSTGQPAA